MKGVIGSRKRKETRKRKRKNERGKKRISKLLSSDAV